MGETTLKESTTHNNSLNDEPIEQRPNYVITFYNQLTIQSETKKDYVNTTQGKGLVKIHEYTNDYIRLYNITKDGTENQRIIYIEIGNIEAFNPTKIIQKIIDNFTNQQVANIISMRTFHNDEATSAIISNSMVADNFNVLREISREWFDNY